MEVKADRERDAAPSGHRRDEVADLGDMRTALVSANELQIHALAQLDKTRAEREAAETLARNWTGFDEKPPYSIHMVDELRDAAGAVNTRLAAMERAGEHLRTEIERLGDETKRAQETLRRAQETMDRAVDPAERQQATWRRDLAQLRLRALGSRTTGTQVLQQVQAEAHGRAAVRAGLAVAQDRAGRAGRDVQRSRPRQGPRAHGGRGGGLAGRAAGRERAAACQGARA